MLSVVVYVYRRTVPFLETSLVPYNSNGWIWQINKGAKGNFVIIFSLCVLPFLIACLLLYTSKTSWSVLKQLQTLPINYGQRNCGKEQLVKVQYFAK